MRIVKYLALAIILLAGVLLVTWWWLLHTNSGANFAWNKTEELLGGALTVTRVGGNIGSGLELYGVRYVADGVEVTADAVSLAADLDLLPLSVRVSDAAITTLIVSIEAASELDAAEPVTASSVLHKLRLPLWILIDDLLVKDVSVNIAGAASRLEISEARLRAQWFDRLYIEELVVETPRESLAMRGNLQLVSPHALNAKVSLSTTQEFVGASDRVAIELQADGTIDKVSFNANGEAELTGYQPIDVVLRGNSTMTRLDIDSFDIDGADLAASGSANVDWRDGLALGADVALRGANVYAVTDAWPEAHPVTGKFSLQIEPGLIRIEDSAFAITGTGAEIVANANIDTSSKVVSGAVSWGELQWPIAADAPDVSSSEGSVNIGGTIDAWRVDGKVKVEAAGVEEGFFLIDGEGDRQHASVRINDANVLGGKLRGQASYTWVERQPWSAELDLAGIETGTILPDWPGVISGSVRASGVRLDKYMTAAFTELNGSVRKRAFVANGGVEIRRKAIIAKKLSLQHGGSEFFLDGNLYGPDGVAFNADVKKLGELLPGASGSLIAAGVVSLNDAGPFLRVEASSDLLTYRDWHVTNLMIVDRGKSDGLLNITAVADDLSFGGRLILEPSIEFKATEKTQSVEATAAYEGMTASIALSGAADQWNAPTRWDGELQKLVIDTADGTRVALDDAVRVLASSERVLMERACLSEPGGAGACLALDWLFAERIGVGASVTRVPLDVVNRVRDTGFDFDQVVNGTVQWQQVIGERATGSGNISVSRGTIVSRDRPSFVVQSDTGTLGFNIQEGQLFAATLQLPMPGTGHVNGQFKVLDVTNPATSPVEGELEFVLDDIAVVSILSPLVDTATGRLRGDVSVQGTVESPLFSGNLNLDNGSISYLPLGLHLDNVNLTSTLAESRRLDVEGSFLAGEGRGEIVSTAEYDGVAAPGLQLALRGKNLTVIDVPDVQAKADVDLRVGFVGDTLAVDGKVFVPHARVQPENLPSSRASVSDDVVIVVGELPDEKKVETVSRLSMAGSVDVTLGNDVIIDLEVAKASLSGATTFKWNGPLVPMAKGRYALAGDIQAFGQVLTIVEGGVRFPNVPASDPYLRIRAEREIFGNSQVKSAGVLVDGTLARPTIQAYTYPATSEERALTLLVTGSDFNYEQGVGAVDFGTYVAPKLFVSYGVGLFGRDNVISARYDLARGFGIKATSGQTESGIDFIYRFER